jgi:hypothetical protein
MGASPHVPAARWAAVCPLGRFPSLAAAALAAGVSRYRARQLATHGLDGWRFLDPGRMRPVSDRPLGHPRGGAHPKARAVVTPMGRFACIADAARAHGITKGAGQYRARLGRKGWRYAGDRSAR